MKPLSDYITETSRDEIYFEKGREEFFQYLNDNDIKFTEIPTDWGSGDNGKAIAIDCRNTKAKVIMDFFGPYEYIYKIQLGNDIFYEENSTRGMSRFDRTNVSLLLDPRAFYREIVQNRKRKMDLAYKHWGKALRSSDRYAGFGFSEKREYEIAKERYERAKEKYAKL